MAIKVNNTIMHCIKINNSEKNDVYVNGVKVYAFYNGRIELDSEVSLKSRSNDGGTVQFYYSSTNLRAAKIRIYAPHDVTVTSITFKYRQTCAYGGYVVKYNGTNVLVKEVNGNNWNNPIDASISTSKVINQSTPIEIYVDANEYTGDIQLEDISINGWVACID